MAQQPAYPLVPGHEIIGRVASVGEAVSGFAVGELVGVGCMVDSCRHCAACSEGLEQYCAGIPDPDLQRPATATTACRPSAATGAHRGLGQVRPAHSQGLDPKAAAPLLCAGITSYSPLRHWKVGPGSRVAVVGLGGLGHMGLKFARALRCRGGPVHPLAGQGRGAAARRRPGDPFPPTHSGWPPSPDAST